jgi:hypothetical protein
MVLAGIKLQLAEPETRAVSVLQEKPNPQLVLDRYMLSVVIS